MAERGVTYWIRYALDRSGLNRAKSDARGAGTQVGGEFEKGIDGPLKRIATTIGALFAAHQLYAWTKAIIGMGVAGAETASKFSATFGSAAGSMDEFLDRVGKAAGLSRNMGRDIASDMGAMVQGMGFSRAESAKLSQQMIQTAADLTSFANVPIERSTHAISSALAGEREQLKMLIGPVSEMAVQTRALAMTGKTNADSLTEQEKALATLAIIQQKMGVRTGDLDRTFDSQANTARRLGGELRTLAETLGAVLISGNPAGDVMASLGKATADATKWVIQNGKAIGAWARVVVLAAKAAFESIRAPIVWLFNAGEVIGHLLQQIAEQIEFYLGGAINRVIEGWNELMPGNVLDIEFRINTKTPAEHQAEMNRLGQGIRKDMLEAGEAVNKLGQSYEAVALAANRAALASGGVSMAAPNVDLPEQGGGLTPEQLLMIQRGAPALTKGQIESKRNAANPGLIPAGRLRGSAPAGTAPGAAQKLEDPIFRQLDTEVLRMAAWRMEMEKTREAAQEMGEGIALSFQTFFETLASGQGGLQSAGKLIRGVAAETLKALVKGKVEYHMAEGVGKLASGMWPPNPLAIASALKHFAAAALFRALPGIVGGSSGGGGGGGGGGSFGAGGSTAAANQPTYPTKQEIHVYIDANDPTNPVYQASVHTANRLATERAGPDGQLGVHVQPLRRVT